MPISAYLNGLAVQDVQGDQGEVWMFCSKVLQLGSLPWGPRARCDSMSGFQQLHGTKTRRSEGILWGASSFSIEMGTSQRLLSCNCPRAACTGSIEFI